MGPASVDLAPAPSKGFGCLPRGRNALLHLVVRRGRSAPLLVSMVGDDPAGDLLLQSLRALHLTTRGVTRCTGAATPTACVVFDLQGEVGIAARWQ